MNNLCRTCLYLHHAKKSLDRRKNPEKYFLENQLNLFRKPTTAFQGGFVFSGKHLESEGNQTKRNRWFLPLIPRNPPDSWYWKSTESQWCLTHGNWVFHTNVLKEIHISLWTEILPPKPHCFIFKPWHLNKSILKRTQNVLPCQLTPKAPIQPQKRV